VKRITYREAIRQALEEEMLRDQKVFIMGEDVGLYGGVYKTTDGLISKFGKNRVRNTPISETAIVGVATGAAIMGARPVAELMYIDFTTMAMDPIVNQAAKACYETAGRIKVPLVIRTQGGVGKSGGSTQSQSLEAWFFHVPGLKIVMPSNPFDAKGLLKTAIRDDNPVIFIEHKALYNTSGEIPEEEYLINFGEAEIKKVGTDVTIIAISREVLYALEAADLLEKQDIDVEVIDPRTLVPLDLGTILNSVKKTNRVVIVHEACLTGGIGAEISSLIQEKAFDSLDAPVKRVAGRNIPIPHSPVLEINSIPKVEDIINAVKEVLYIN